MTAKHVPLMTTVSALALTAMLGGLALAQTQPQTPTPPTTEKSSPSTTRSATDKKVVVPDGAVTRANAVIGTPVRDGGGDKIGTVDDLLMGSDAKVNYVVLSVGGFLGIGDKLVAVPMDDVKMAADHMVMPSATKESVSKMPKFDRGAVHYPGYSKEVPRSMPPSGSSSDRAPSNTK